MTKAKLVILRHGQTEHNKQSLMTGQLDIPLTSVGEEQAREAGSLIRRIHFHKAYSSNLSRAFNTAALALEASKTQKHLLNADGTWQIEQRKEIAEVDTGDFTGRNHKTDPEIVNWKRQFDVPIPGGESEKQVVARVQKFFDDEVMPRLLKGENVLVVAHAGILRTLDVVLGLSDVPENGMMATKKSIPNATPTVYTYEDGILKTIAPLVNPKAVPPANQNDGKKPSPKRKGVGL